MPQTTQMLVLQAFLNRSRYVLLRKNFVAIYCTSETTADIFLYYFRSVGTPLCLIYFPFQCLFILQ